MAQGGLLRLLSQYIKMSKVSLKAFAKVNVGLQIRSKRNDSFHNIHTVFQEINLFDTLILSKQKNKIDFSSNVSWLKNDDSNLCIKAFNKMKSIYNLNGIRIILMKNIPTFAGLGGGSSNAAAIIKGVNILYNLKLSNKKLELIGSQVGSDVSFFIEGGTQLGEGVGDRLIKIKKKVSGKFLLVMPKLEISTAWAYKRAKIFLDRRREFINLGQCLKKEIVPFEFFDNDFEKIIIPAYPEIGKIINLLRNKNAKYAGLSGSGSTVFGIFDDKAKVNKAFSHFSPMHKTHIAHPV